MIKDKLLPLTKGECPAQPDEGVTLIDNELQNLVELSGLKENFIAEKCNITPQYFSMLKNCDRTGTLKRVEVKLWLANYIRHTLTFKMAA